MARVKGVSIASTYDVTKRQPFDARMLVTKYEDLINPSIWVPTGLSNQTNYNMMITGVNSGDINAGIYYLNDRTKITDDNYNAYLNAVNSGESTLSYFSMWTRLCNINEFNNLVLRVEQLEKNGGTGTGGGITQDDLDAAMAQLRQEISQLEGIEVTQDVTVDDTRAVSSGGVYDYVEEKIGTIYTAVSKI